MQICDGDDIADAEDERCLEFRNIQLTPQILRLLQAIVLGHCKVTMDAALHVAYKMMLILYPMP